MDKLPSFSRKGSRKCDLEEVDEVKRWRFADELASPGTTQIDETDKKNINSDEI
jgi:hypothetical protein